MGQRAFGPAAQVLTQKDIDTSVRRSLEKEPLPSAYAKAHATIAPSVVRVEGDDGPDDAPPEAAQVPTPGKAAPKKKATADSEAAALPHRAIGTGVVIIDNGTILTNLHVVAGSKRLKVTFADGSESDAILVGAQPEHDLAVLRARSIPDDLVAATMRSTADLAPGDEVIAVGFPFGIGPSVSGGVVSGLKREFRSPQGHRKLTNLIQFDAAANPGNSGGPLVTMDGSVVGIVTAILNPSEQRTFIGIGFAVPIENAAAAAGMPPF
ncbi:MAG TPA: trypsin-like peptidase domain-containing protein [Rhizobacter sp.]